MESAVVELDSQGRIFEDDDIDVDSLLQGFPFDLADDLDLWMSNSSADDSSPSTPEEPVAPIAEPSFAAEEVERFLMEDDDERDAQGEDDGKYVDEFLAAVLVDGSGFGSASDSGRSEVASPESGGSAESERAAAAKQARNGVVVIDGVDREEEDEPISKKRIRYFY